MTISRRVKIFSQRRRKRISTRKHILQFVSTLIIPLVLGVFTIVTTFHQQKIAREQRLEDLYESRNQRQHEENYQREFAKEQYQDELLVTYIKDIAILLKESNGSLTSDEVTANITRAKTLNVFHQLDAKRNIQIIRFLYEAGQLAPVRERRPLDLSSAKLRNIDFRDTAIDEKQLKHLSLNSIILFNAIFFNIELDSSSFTRTQFRTADFSSGQINNTNFSSATFDTANFSLTILYNIRFSNARFTNINFSCAQLDTVDFMSTKLENASFSMTSLNNANFALTQLNKCNFSNAKLSHSNFSFSSIFDTTLSFASFFKTSFSTVQLINVNFLYSHLLDISFAPTEYMRYVNFSYAFLNNVGFAYFRIFNIDLFRAQLTNVNFSYMTLESTNFSYTELRYVNFIDVELERADFSSAVLSNFNRNFLRYLCISILDYVLVSASFYGKASGTNFRQITCVATRFDNADLSHSNFWHANLKYASFVDADLTGVNFSGTNLYYVNFTGANITDRQLREALAIQQTLLPNGTFASDANLIQNGQADCRILFVDSWTMEFGHISVERTVENNSNCQFSLQSHITGAEMFQRVHLLDRWNSTSWPYTQSILTARMSHRVSIVLRAVDDNNEIIIEQSLNSTGKSVRFILNDNIQELEVRVTFSPYIHTNMDTTTYWCDDIQLRLIYGTYLEHLRIMPTLAINAEWIQEGRIIAGNQTIGNESNQLFLSLGICVDDQMIAIADQSNDRVVQWNIGDHEGVVVAGGHGSGSRLDQLDGPTNVLIDRETESFIICDCGNQRVVQWPFLLGRETHGKVLIDNITCWGLTMDDRRYLYVSDVKQHAVHRYDIDRKDKHGTIVAGGHGQGNFVHQLDGPSYLFVDRQQSVYVSDSDNHRVMKWKKDSIEGIVVAGGHGEGETLKHAYYPQGLFADTSGTVYVVEGGNHRITRWFPEAQYGSVIMGGRDPGDANDQFNGPTGLSFDRHGQLYVVDRFNFRVLQFSRK